VLLDTLVFSLALGAYASLGVAAVVHSRQGDAKTPARLTAVLVSGHVLGVWAHRFGWSLSEATENGWRGFFLFHLAYVLIVAAPFATCRARELTYAGFLIVSGGAVGAVFKYDVVTPFRYPVLLVAVSTLTLVARAHLGRWRRRAG
jgi:hypothetical protein